MHSNALIGLPNYYFHDRGNYLTFWRALKDHAESSRALPEQILESLQSAAYDGVIIGYVVSDIEHLSSDSDYRTFRNILQEDRGRRDDAGAVYPKRYSRSYDVLRLMSIWLQYEDFQYKKHVEQWRGSQLSF